jgi:hypothetical protein
MKIAELVFFSLIGAKSYLSFWISSSFSPSALSPRPEVKPLALSEPVNLFVLTPGEFASGLTAEG